MKPCSDIRRLIRGGQRRQVEDHLETCASCATFAEAFEVIGLSDVTPERAEDLEETFQGIEAHLSHRSRLRGFVSDQPTPRRLLGVLGIGALTLVAIWALNRRVDWDVYPLLRWLWEATGFAVILTVHAVTHIRPQYRPPQRLETRFVIGLATLGMLATPLLLPLAHEAHPASLEGIDHTLASRALACFSWGSAVSFGIAGAAFLVARGSKISTTLSASFFLIIGLFSQLALHLHCPIVHPLHIGLGHSSIAGAALLLFLVLRGVSVNR